MKKILILGSVTKRGKAILKKAFKQGMDVSIVGAAPQLKNIAKKYSFNYLGKNFKKVEHSLKNFWAVINCDQDFHCEAFIDFCKLNQLNYYNHNGETLLSRKDSGPQDTLTKQLCFKLVGP
ncbi:hypothetical protein PQO01_06015 [Lentisphaera marina]|uniref:hypothetical protein n=1 Tax=Lentisphaera marina TaxID=1111041 RepID=UPI002365CE6C|nr:hypothetical protein [Lentisphaera marina]MDD7984502.1 hypothetical protein [Lentisphaera marina]